MTHLKSRVARGVASVSAGLVLAASVGVAGASGGPWSHHHGGGNKVETEVTNSNTVVATNNNTQNAQSGDATVDPGTKDKHHCSRSCDWDNEDPAVAGDATTGGASNDNMSDLSVSIDNSGVCDCLQGLGGEGSGSVKTTITNTNSVVVTNNNLQNALSGNATVSGNGGSATTGNASNSNSTTVSISISN
jgi:hypothetical protein